jgi:hypothetical protein
VSQRALAFADTTFRPLDRSLSRKGDFQIAPAVWKPPLLGIVFTGIG